MSVEIMVPYLSESVSEATIGRWYKQQGETVVDGEVILELESDKANLEVTAPATGILGDVRFKQGDTVGVNDVLAVVLDSASAKLTPAKTEKKTTSTAKPTPAVEEKIAEKTEAKATHKINTVAIFAAVDPDKRCINSLTTNLLFCICSNGKTEATLTFIIKYKIAIPAMEMNILFGIFFCGLIISPPK